MRYLHNGFRVVLGLHRQPAAHRHAAQGWMMLASLAGALVVLVPAGLHSGGAHRRQLAKGIDLRKHGSGNLGATNVIRVLGTKIGLLVFAFDMAKGAAPGRCLSALAAGRRAAHRRSDDHRDRVRCGGDHRPRAADLSEVRQGREGRRHRRRRLSRARADSDAAHAHRLRRRALVERLRVARVAHRRDRCCRCCSRSRSACGRRCSRSACSSRVFVFWTHRANIARLRSGEEHRFGKRGVPAKRPGRDAGDQPRDRARRARRGPIRTMTRGEESLMRCAVVGARRVGNGARRSARGRRARHAALGVRAGRRRRRSTRDHENRRFLAGMPLSPRHPRDERSLRGGEGRVA